MLLRRPIVVQGYFPDHIAPMTHRETMDILCWMNSKYFKAWLQDQTVSCTTQFPMKDNSTIEILDIAPTRP